MSSICSRCLDELPWGLEIAIFGTLVAICTKNITIVLIPIAMLTAPTAEENNKTMEAAPDHFVINSADIFDCTRRVVLHEVKTTKFKKMEDNAVQIFSLRI